MAFKSAVTPPIRRRVAVIYNPVAGFRQRGRLRRFLRHLRRLGHEVLLRRTEGPGHATQIARDLDPAQVDVVVAAGGDGTINEVANGLIGRPIPMTIAPLGTANVFAFETGLGLKLSRAARLPSEGLVAEIRPALAGKRGFLLMVSAGTDARVVANVDRGMKRYLGKTAYVLAAVREILSGRPGRIQVTVDGVRHEAGLVVVTHACHYAGPFVIAPNVRMGDDSVCVVLLKGVRRRSLVKYAMALLLNRLPTLKDATVLRAHRVRIDGPEGQPIQSDGDVIGQAPMDIVLGSRPLRILVPDLARVLPLQSAPGIAAGTDGALAKEPVPAQ
ncbi:MAG: diacylglycerol kinase family protein [Alphaproteobacteria bacterium]|nr:diacylglycerol kinase family protein [Alphaproteobacteria bacterium]